MGYTTQSQQVLDAGGQSQQHTAGSTIPGIPAIKFSRQQQVRARCSQNAHAQQRQQWLQQVRATGTFLAIDLALLDVEATGADGLVALDADEAVHVVRVLHGVHDVLSTSRTHVTSQTPASLNYKLNKRPN